MSISNCGHDERGKYSGGVAGDQTGTEYQVRNWYDRPWKCVLRYPDAVVGKRIATISKNAAKNENIGYDQYQRITYYNELKAVNWRSKRIKKKCEADCSSSTAANVIAAGHQLGLKKLQEVNPNCTTFNLRAALKAAGFNVLTDSKYLTSDAYLLPGDILLNDECHVAVNLTKGAKATLPIVPKRTLRKGNKHTLANKRLQRCLNYLGYTDANGKALVVDGVFGASTEQALNKFKKAYGLPTGGTYGTKAKAKMKSLIK